MRLPAACLLLALAALAVSAEDAPDSVVAVADGRATVKPVCRLDYRGIIRSSALQHWQGAWWTLNDGGDGPILYRSAKPDFTGAQPVEVPGAKSADWEALAVLGDDLLVCDIGDNRLERSEYAVYRLAWDAKTAKLKTLATYRVNYPDGRHNAEAAAVIDGKLHLFPRRGRLDANTGAYRFNELKEGELNTAELAGKLEIDERAQITAADYDAAKQKLLLLSYTRLYVFSKPEGAPERSVRIYAQRCESLCLHENALLYGNEQGQLFRVKGFLDSNYTELLPPREQAELPAQEESVDPDGTGEAWQQGAFELRLQGLGEGEYLRWKVCGPRLLVAGGLRYDVFSSSSEHGPRRGSALVLMFARDESDFLEGSETHLWLGDNGATGVDAWTLGMQDFSLKPLQGVKAAGKVRDRYWSFEYAIPLTAIFGEGKLPEKFYANAWGYNLKGRDEPRLAGESFGCWANPYTWAEVAVK
jgi:hypothetical protein